MADIWADWSTTAASNTPVGTDSPTDLHDQLQNIKAQVKANAADIVNDQTVDGIKTFSHIPILPASNPTTVNQAVRANLLQSNVTNYGVAGGTGDTLTLTLSPVLGAYVAGQLIAVTLTASNTGASTINVNSLGAKTIKRRNADGSLGDTVLTDLISGQTILLLYDGTYMCLITKPMAVGISAASQAEQEAGSEAAHYVAPATQQFHPSSVKFYITINGATGNVVGTAYNATCSRTSTGFYVVTIGTDFSSANWVPMVAAYRNTTSPPVPNLISKAAGEISVKVYNIAGDLIDVDELYVCGFGDQ
jgi:hypothetical protein